MKSLVFFFIISPSIALADCRQRIGLDRIDELEKQVEYLTCMHEEQSLLIKEAMHHIHMLGLQSAAHKMRFLALEKALKDKAK